MNIDWKRKLTSRKMWLAIAEFVTMLIVALGGAEEIATQVAAIIMAGAGVIGYVIAEGLVDAANSVPAIEAIEQEIEVDTEE